jgi:hypothetical protein
MNAIKTKSIRGIEQKMEELDPQSLRYRVLDCAKDFKASWIGLGQLLFTVWKDKLYKDWGYQEFNAYAAKEIGVRKETALKLLRSYSFLEKEEPRYLTREYNEGAEAKELPNYEAVDLLRRANSNKELDKKDYAKIRKYVLEDGKDVREVRKDLTQMVKDNSELDSEEARSEKRKVVLKRFLSTLKSVKKEIKASKMLPASIVKEADLLIEKLEAEIR